LPLQFGASTLFDPGMKPKNVPRESRTSRTRASEHDVLHLCGLCQRRGKPFLFAYLH